MNLSKIAFDNVELEIEEVPIDKSQYRVREGELAKIIEALGRVNQTEDWKVLKQLIFDGEEEGIGRKLNSEAKKLELNNPEIYRLQGKLEEARKFSKLEELANRYKVELKNIRQILKT